MERKSAETWRKWTDGDEKFLIDNYDKLEIKKLARHLNRSVDSVHTRASKLGIKKRRLVKDLEEEIREMAKAEYTVSEIAKKLDYEYETIWSFLKENNITTVPGVDNLNKKALENGIEEYNQKPIDAKNVTFGEYFKHWYNVYRKESIREVTKVKYRITYQHAMELNLGQMKLSEITRADVQTYITRYGRSRSKQTVYDHMQHIRSCFKDAVLDGLIKQNPAANANAVYKEQELSVTEQKELREQKKWLEIHEYQKLRYYLMFRLQQILKEPPLISLGGSLQNSQQIMYMMIFIAMKTGARLSEFAGLTRSDVLYDKNSLNIDKSWDYKGIAKEGSKFQPTKNIASIREVIVDNETMDLLKKYTEWLDQHQIETQEKTLFMIEGLRLHNSTTNDHLVRLLKELNIEPITMHKLRHTHASYLIAKNVPLQVVAKRLGHTNTNMIQKVYGHLLEETEQMGNRMIVEMI